MAKAEERMHILKMVESGQITAADASLLLGALADTEASPAREPEAERARMHGTMRVRVTDLATGQEKVNISLPLGLAAIGMRMGARFTPRDLDLDLSQIVGSARGGAQGKVMEVVDEEEGERVEIYVE